MKNEMTFLLSVFSFSSFLSLVGLVRIAISTDSLTDMDMIQQLPLSERQTKTRKRRETGITELVPDPIEQFKYDLSGCVQKWGTKHSANDIIMGDFNIDLHKNNKNRVSLMKWASDLGLVNPYVEMQKGDTPEEKLHTIDKAHEQGDGIYTWYSSEQKHINRPDCRCSMCTGASEPAKGKVSRAHLDHVWMSRDLYRRRALMGYGVAISKSLIRTTDP